MESEKEEIKILSIDGGGIRGIIPSVFLGEIRNILTSYSGKNFVYEHFDMLAGTSTGGMLALGLATSLGRADFNLDHSREPKMNFQELINLYSRKGHLIFPPPSIKFGSAIQQIFHYKYAPDNLEKILMELFGDSKMNHMLRPTVITSFDIENNQPFIFRMYPDEHHKQDWKNFYIRDVARCTSAAPTYFPPALVSPCDFPDQKYVLVDGGVVLNNPSLLAYAEAKTLFPKAKRFKILSLGTGTVPISLSYEQTKNWGALGWMNPSKGLPLLEVIMSGQSVSANYMLEQLPDVELYRMNININPLHKEMDNPGAENVQYLQKVAAQYVHQSFEWLKKVCRRFID